MRSRVMPGAPLLLLGLLGCEPSSLDQPTPPPSTEQPAVLHFVQGAFALPKIELLIDKQAYATLDYRQAKGSITLPAGEHELVLRAPGTSSTLFTSGLVLQQGQRLLLLSRWGRDEKGARAVTVQAEALGMSDPAGVKLRLLHASEGAPDFVRRVTAALLDGRGESLPVSAFPVDGTWPAALAEFLASRDLYPTWGNTLGAASSLIGAGLTMGVTGIALAYALPWVPWLGRHIDRREHAASAQVAFRFNSYVALALAERLAGAPGVAWQALLMSVCVPVCNVAAVWPLALWACPT